MERLSHDQMAFAIAKLHPKLTHGKDFWAQPPVSNSEKSAIREMRNDVF